MAVKRIFSVAVGITVLLALLPSSSLAQGAISGSRAVREIIAAERSFAADTRARGPGLSFRAAVARDAVAIRPDPENGVMTVVNARERLQAAPSTPRATNIRWWPIFAGAATSGDIGFTTGPVIFSNGRFGYIFTVWTRQPNGTWRYYFDGGPAVDQAPTTTADSPVAILPPVRFTARTASAAEAEVRQAEDDLHRASRTTARQAYLPYLTEATRLMGSGIVPTVGISAAARELERRAVSMEFTPLGMRASRAGDLVFSYGRARTDRANGGYTRIWQKQRGGWRLIIDQVQFPAPRAAG